MKKIAIFGFTGELMCFAHALINADEMISKGWDVRVVLEGTSTKLIPALESDENPFRAVYTKLKNSDDVISVCQACANKMGTLDLAREIGLKLDNSLLGHPSMHEYIEKGYEIVTI
ncbi:MAG TPA: cytoplasmic protein [Spirochaeta sp.]|nr:cytoplasmic protein [Spirochaeta sp.]